MATRVNPKPDLVTPVKSVSKLPRSPFSDFANALKVQCKLPPEDYYKAADMDVVPVKEWLQTPLPGLNSVLSGGRGIAVGRAFELFGNEQTGKTAMCELLIALAVKQGGRALVINAEMAVDRGHLRSYGVTDDEMVDVHIVEPDHMELAWKVVYAFLSALKSQPASGPSIIVWDSVAGTPTRSEVESDGDVTVAEQARVMSRHQRVFRKRLSRSRAFAVFTNQLRSKIGGMGYGDNSVRPCGKALDFMCDAFLKLAIIKSDLSSGATSEDKKGRGFFIVGKAMKNRLAPPLASTVWYLSFKRGIDPDASILRDLKRLKIAKPAGASIRIKLGGNEVKTTSAEWPTFLSKNRQAILSELESKAARAASRGSETDDDSDVTSDE